MGDPLPLVIAVYAGFVFCIVVHECAHVLVAAWLGDDTAWLQGRFTLNPIPHIDPFMSIILPLALYLSNLPIFGGAKPVPVVMNNLRGNRLIGMCLVALAGPVSNLILAVIFALLLNAAHALRPVREALADNLQHVFLRLVVVNVSLALFNLLPIPPLDGSRILAAMLPRQTGWKIYEWERFGWILVAMLVWTGGTTKILSWPVLKISEFLLTYLFVNFH